MEFELDVVCVKTVILGAGFAGISASVNLLRNNYDQFLIYESLERIGGRACTEIDDKGYFERGCQWIHGQKNNSLFNIALENGLIKEGYEELKAWSKIKEVEPLITSSAPDQLLQDVDASACNGELLFVTQHGQKIRSEFAQSIYDRITRLIASAKDESLSTTNFDMRYGDFLYDGLYAELNKELGAEVTSDLRSIIDGLFMMRCKRENISAGTANIFDVSFKHFATWKEFEGCGYVELKKSYGAVIDVVIGPYREAFDLRLNLNCYMKKIYLCQRLDAENEGRYVGNCFHCKFTRDTGKAVVRMCHKEKDFFVVCERVLCTMSLGYWKENLNQMLDPIGFVTNERRLAVLRLGFGTINKIFLFYDKPFWNKNLELIHMVWLPQDSNFQLDKFIHRNSNSRVWTEDICKIEVVSSYPNALCLWIAGSEFFERLEDTTVSSECTELLRRFLDDESIPYPTAMSRSKWNTDRFFRGSYSHIPLGGDPMDFKRLAQPIPSTENPIVLFAGEATHECYFQTTHGAFLTGLRESERILKSHSNKGTFNQ